MADEHLAAEAQFSDYVDGVLPAPERDQLEAHLAACARCRAELENFRETLAAVSGLHKLSAPPSFDRDVRETIHRRSGGRFFGRRAFGDRVPFELIAVLALALMIGVYALMRASSTGSAQLDPSPQTTPAPTPEAEGAVPRP